MAAPLEPIRGVQRAKPPQSSARADTTHCQSTVWVCKGHLEKQLETARPCCPKVTKRRPCAIPRWPAHDWGHMRARPCRAGCSRTEAGTGHTQPRAVPAPPGSPCALSRVKNTSFFSSHVVMKPAPPAVFATTAPAPSTEPFLPLGDEERTAALPAALRAIRDGQDMRKTRSGTPTWQPGANQVSGTWLWNYLNAGSFTILTQVFLLNILREGADKRHSWKFLPMHQAFLILKNNTKKLVKKS